MIAYTILRHTIRAFVGAGGTVVVPSSAPMLRSAAFVTEVCGGNPLSNATYLTHVSSATTTYLKLLTKWRMMLPYQLAK